MQVSAYRPNVDSNFRLDRTDSLLDGTNIDGESDLGLAPRKTVPAVLLGLRLSERWRAEFEYLSLNRRSSTSVASIGGINFGDGQFNADIDARLRTPTGSRPATRSCAMPTRSWAWWSVPTSPT